MPTAKKLPSGSWRCQVYSHTEEIIQPDGTVKKKRIYESFTDTDPSPKGRRRCEKAAADWAADKERLRKKGDSLNLTLREAIDKYVSSRDSVLSVTTLQDYRCIQKNAFVSIMDKKLSELDEETLQNAINEEAKRPSKNRSKNPVPLSPKRVLNEWGLVASVINKYGLREEKEDLVLPTKGRRFHELIEPDTIFGIVKGTDIELPVLLAMWLSFTMSEIRGLTKSRSISGNYITIVEVVVDVDGRPVRKSLAKNSTRNRRHRIPPYIADLISKVEGDTIVPESGKVIYHRWKRLLQRNNLPPLTFHDLRHVNASVMAMLRIPDKYAQERGGWKSDSIMKSVYMETFSDERKRIDAVIDAYFENMMQHDIQHEFAQAL